MVLTGWFFVNIVAPLLLPVVGILPLRLLPLGAHPSGLLLMSTVKDGQLCWAVIAMGTSTIYELWVALEAHKQVPTWAGVALAGVILIMLPAMTVAAGGSVFSTPIRTTSARGFRAWFLHYKVFVASVVMAAVAAFIYTELHFGIAP